MRRPGALASAVAVVATVVLALTATAAHAAENPVLDPTGDDDVASALAEAQEVQGVCYGYVLQVTDSDTGQFSGTFATSSLGAGVDARDAPGCSSGSVVVAARIAYTSDFSEAEDSASWSLLSTVGGLSIADVEAVTGGSASDLLDDSRSETALLNAVLSLPGLASEQAGLPPVVLEANTEPLPEGARATDPPSSDWLRQHGSLLALCAAAIGAGLVALLVSFRPARDRSRPRTFGPAPRHPGPPPRPAQPPSPQSRTPQAPSPQPPSLQPPSPQDPWTRPPPAPPTNDSRSAP